MEILLMASLFISALPTLAPSRSAFAPNPLSSPFSCASSGAVGLLHPCLSLRAKANNGMETAGGALPHVLTTTIYSLRAQACGGARPGTDREIRQKEASRTCSRRAR